MCVPVWKKFMGQTLWKSLSVVLGDIREESVTVDQHLKDLEMQSPQEIVSEFYQTVTGGDVLSERQTALVESIFEEIGRSRQ